MIQNNRRKKITKITGAIKKLKSNKARRWDAISGDVFKNIHAIPFLHDYLILLLDSGYFPQLWAKSIIVSIFRKGDTDVTGNYQGF